MLVPLCNSGSDVLLVSDLKTGRSEGSARRVLPELVQADPGPAVPHIYGARSGGAEELQHPRQVSCTCSSIQLSYGTTFYCV